MGASSRSGWLVTPEGQVLASLEMPTSAKAKLKGLIRAEEFRGAFYLEGAKWIHTFGMKFDIDVAFVSNDGEIIQIASFKPNRVSAIVLRSSGVIEAEAGAFEKWGLHIGQSVSYEF